jgi:hypothetical protein
MTARARYCPRCGVGRPLQPGEEPHAVEGAITFRAAALSVGALLVVAAVWLVAFFLPVYGATALHPDETGWVCLRAEWCLPPLAEAMVWLVALLSFGLGLVELWDGALAKNPTVADCPRCLYKVPARRELVGLRCPYGSAFHYAQWHKVRLAVIVLIVLATATAVIDYGMPVDKIAQ